MFNKLRGLVSNYFFKLQRMQPLSGAHLLTRAESDELLEPHGIRVATEVLCQDLCLLVLGSELKNRYEVEAGVALELSRKFPKWLRIVPGLEGKVRDRISKGLMREWFILDLLQSLRLPGANFNRTYLSAAVLYYCAKAAVGKYEVPIEEVKEWLVKVTHLAKSVTEDELILLESLPSDALMAELPEALAKQFELEQVDPEFFFSGEAFRAAYAVGKAVRKFKPAQKKDKDRSGNHLYTLEMLLSHPGRAIILDTSRRLDRFQAFVLQKLKEFHVDPSGDEMRRRAIREPSEIRGLRGSTLALSTIHPTLFWKRVLERSVDVREFGYIEEERPRAHLLIDKSPSMLFFGKLFKAGGVLFNRLLHVLNDSADIEIQLFDGDIRKRIAIDGPYEAEQAMTFVRMANFIGSGTDIDKALRATTAAVKKLPHRSAPDHVILVSDGKAEISLDPNHFERVKLHCFLLGGSNEQLRAICHETGGVYQEC